MHGVIFIAATTRLGDSIMSQLSGGEFQSTDQCERRHKREMNTEQARKRNRDQLVKW